MYIVEREEEKED